MQVDPQNEISTEKTVSLIVFIRAFVYPLKYRNIKNEPKTLERFYKWLQLKYPGIDHINIYGKESKKFLYQKRF